MRWSVIVVLVLLGFIPANAQQGHGSLLVFIDGFRSAEGKARVAVFQSGAGFPEDEARAYRTAVVTIRDGRGEVRFDGLPAASYAVSMYHDQNDDQKLNKGLFGIPEEGYGVSNNVTPTMRAPKFTEAVFPLLNALHEIHIRVHY